jgi:Tlde1 domain
MTWTYAVSTGTLYNPSGIAVGWGYSGAGEYKNDPTAEPLHDLGPIPEGVYRIGDPVDTVTHGPYVLPLTPDPANEMYERSSFLIHGDSVVSPGSASNGCIIQSHATRLLVGQSMDKVLEVIKGDS